MGHAIILLVWAIASKLCTTKRDMQRMMNEEASEYVQMQ